MMYSNHPAMGLKPNIHENFAGLVTEATSDTSLLCISYPLAPAHDWVNTAISDILE